MKAAERRAAVEAARRRIYSPTGEQAQVLREAFDAGPDGLYMPCVGHVGRVAGELAAGGCGEVREVRTWTATTRSSRDPRPIGFLPAWYFVPNARGLEMIGICTWPPAWPARPALVRRLPVLAQPLQMKV